MHEKKRKAIELRKKEKSYREISKEIGVSKSTLSDWLKDKEWSQEIKKKLIKKSKKQADHSHLKYYREKRAREAAEKREKEKKKQPKKLIQLVKNN